MVAVEATAAATAAAAVDEPSIPTTRMKRAAAWQLLLLLVPWLVRIIMRRAEHLPAPWAVGEGPGVVDHVAEEEREEEEEGAEDS